MGRRAPTLISRRFNIMSDPKAIAPQFLQHYYGLYDTDRSQLAAMFTNDSSLTFEGQEFKGQQAIIQKLTSLTFTSVKHDLSTARCDVQTTSNNGIFILVTGVLSVDNAPPLNFCDTFILHQNGASWYIHNMMFRLNVS